MPLKRGLWLTLIDDAGESYPVACDVSERRPDLWVLDAMIPPQVYPVCFVAARLRLDGNFLGMLRFAEPFETVTHQPRDVRIEFPIDARRLEGTSFETAPASR
ncbi:MAG: hypothetical protein ACO1SX_04005 [Actinomycetota bacterium]